MLQITKWSFNNSYCSKLITSHIDGDDNEDNDVSKGYGNGDNGCDNDGNSDDKGMKMVKVEAIVMTMIKQMMMNKAMKIMMVTRTVI